MKIFYCWVTFILILFSNPSYTQTFDFVEVPNPPGLQFNDIADEIDDKLYLLYTDDYYNLELYSFDQSNLESVALPSGYTAGFYLATVGNKGYIALNDNNFVTSLGVIENEAVSVYPATGTANEIGQFLYSDGDMSYFQYWDFTTFDQFLKSFDGNSFIDITSPSGFTFDSYLGELDGLRYFTFENSNFDAKVFSYDGINFTELDTPPDLQFPNLVYEGNDRVLFSAFDYNFDQILLSIDASGVEEVTSPNNFPIFSGQPLEFNNSLYLSFSDNNFNNQTLFKLESDDSWTAIPNPTGYEFTGTTTGGNLEDKSFVQVSPIGTFDTDLTCFNGTEFIDIILSGNQKFLNDLYTPYRGGYLAGLGIEYYYSTELNFLKDGTFQVVPLPSPQLDFDFYEGTFSNKAYLSYNEGYYNQFLYFLSLNTLPVSSDSSVTTQVETPYSFETTDFPFSDADIEDDFGGIQIATLPTKGILHLNGAQVNVDDIIKDEDLAILFYVPLDGGNGMPYDQFDFRVWDGIQVSELSYTMFINVTGSVSTNELAQAVKVIYPNPTRGAFNLSLNEGTDLNGLSMVILNNLGQAVYNQNITQLNSEILLSNVPSGNYFVILRNEQYSSVQKIRLIK